MLDSLPTPPAPARPSPALARRRAVHDGVTGTATEVAEDSGEILLDGSDQASRQRARMATGTGERADVDDDAATRDEPIRKAGAAKLPPPAVDGALNDAFFVVTAGSDRGRRFPLARARLSIGRSMDNDVVLTDIAVSRKHLVIEFDGTHYVLTDLGSGNGTLVNGRDEDGTYRLVDGDRLELGNTVLVFECPTMSSVAQLAHAAAPKNWGRKNDDDEMSTVAGRKPPRGLGESQGVKPLPLEARDPRPPPRPPNPRAPSTIAVDDSLAPRAPAVLRESPQIPLTAPPAAPTLAAEAFPTGPSHGGMGGPSQPLMHPSHLTTGGSMGGPHGGPHDRSMGGPMGPGPSMGQMPGLNTLNSSGSAPGYVPYPSPVSYPSAPSYPAPGAQLAPAPRYQYPNGVMGPAPGQDKRKLLIGVIGVALVAAIGGIAIAVVKGGDKGDKGKTVASATETGSTAVAAGAAAGDESTTPDDKGAGTDDKGAGTDDKGDATTASGDPTAAKVSGDPAAAAKPVEPEPVQMASLLTGTRTLTPTAFGTDETGVEDEVAAAAAAAETDGADRTADARDRDARDRDARDRDARDRDARDARDRDARDRREREERERREREARERAERDRRPDPAPANDGPDLDDVLEEAAENYADTKFGEAVGVLRRAARGASKKDASRLNSLASGYERVGNAMRQAQSSSDPGTQLKQYKIALRADEQYGDGEHQSVINSKIALIAPRAAGSAMAGGRFAEARAACEDAERAGAGDAVKRHRESLERKATDKANEAAALAKQGKDAEAAALAAEVLKMVPKSSPAYSKAAPLAR